MQNISNISAPKLTQHVVETTGKNCHSETVKSERFISWVNQQNLLEFAKYYINKDFEFWKKVAFTDGRKYNIFGYDGRENFREKEHGDEYQMFHSIC